MKLYYNPLSGYSMKVLLALAEKNIPFERKVVNLMDSADKAAYKKIYPIGKVPLLELGDGYKIPESSIIIEWIDQHHDTNLIPTGSEESRKARFFDRMADLYIQNQVGTIFFDGLKPEEKRNPEAVSLANYYLDTTFGHLNKELEGKDWLVGSRYSIADLSMFPGLFYAQNVHPYSQHTNIVNYFQRLMDRPATQTLMKEVGPALEEWERSTR